MCRAIDTIQYLTQIFQPCLETIKPRLYIAESTSLEEWSEYNTIKLPPLLKKHESING